jgi:hypothetical protein
MWGKLRVSFGSGMSSRFGHICDGGLGIGSAPDVDAAWILKGPAPSCRVTCLTTGSKDWRKSFKQSSFPLPPTGEPVRLLAQSRCLEAPEWSTGSFLFFFFWHAETGTHRSQEGRKDGGDGGGAKEGTACALLGNAPRKHPAVAGGRRARVPLSPTAVASGHDIAVATKRRRPALQLGPHTTRRGQRSRVWG